MLTVQEIHKMRLIQDMARRGLAREVSRADKQWVLDIASREGSTIPAPAAAMAMRDGYKIGAGAVISIQTVTL